MSFNTSGLPPFPAEYRASGLLLHVTSLPSPYGIGDLGPPAVAWIDRLAEAGQSWWQMLPLGPTGYGNSPYQSLSSFAVNTALVSPDWLIEDELVRASDCGYHQPDPSAVDYESVIQFKMGLLERARANFEAGARPDLRPVYAWFRECQAHWVEDYVLFQALKQKFNSASYLDWPLELVRRDAAALDRVRRELQDEIDKSCFSQFLVCRQAERLKERAHNRGVGLIGDLPFFVSADSSDVWAEPKRFLLDEKYRRQFVAGVPPDYFSLDGQLWGNPVYDWGAHRQEGYHWWAARLRALLTYVDLVRLDHFRGFAATWNVPAGLPNAKSGEWVEGPGAEFFQVMRRELGALPFIAEDLGFITPDVYALRDEFRLPGMRVLQFAFNGDPNNPYLPEKYVKNSVVYTGTHDNPTIRGWFEDLPFDQRQNLLKLVRPLGGANTDVAHALTEVTWSSRAALAVAPLQDLLNLGNEARMNVPGRAQGNWCWRATEEMLSDTVFEGLKKLTRATDRLRALGTLSQPKALEVGTA